MTTEDQIVALFAKANPVPSLDLLDPVEPFDVSHFTDPSERSGAMTELKTEAKEGIGGRKPRLIPVLAVTVITVVALGLVLNRNDGVASPVSVATAFMNATAEHDANAAWELLAPDSEAKLAGLAALTSTADWDRAVGWVEISQGCEEKSSGPDGTLVACPFIRETDWIRALGLEPVTNNIYEILVAEGQIQSVVETDNGEVSRDGMFEASRTFQAWVVANHPDDVATMYGLSGQWLENPESIALYEQYTDEFVASVEG